MYWVNLQRRIAVALVSVAAAASLNIEALACTPSPGVVYDDFDGPTTLVVTADVVQFELVADQAAVCLHTRYSVRKVLAGTYKAPLEVSVCYPGSLDGPDKLRREKEGLQELGFADGAFVLAGMTRAPAINTSPRFGSKRAGGFRYVYPNCWGLAHFNLGQLGEQERDEFLKEFRAGLRPDGQRN